MDWKPREDLCQECSKIPFAGTVTIGGIEIRLCQGCKERLFGINNDGSMGFSNPLPTLLKEPITNVTTLKLSRRKMFEQAQDYVKNLNGQFMPYTEFVKMFSGLVTKKNRLGLGKFSDSKLIVVKVSSNRFVVYGFPYQRTTCGTLSADEFEKYIVSRRAQPNTTYNTNRLSEAIRWLETQPAMMVEQYIFKEKFPKLLKKNGKLIFPRKSRLKNVYVGQKTLNNRYVMLDVPWKDTPHKSVTITEFEMFVSKRLGMDWYLPGSKNRPRTELEPIIRAVREKRKQFENKIEPLPETINNIEIDPSLAEYITLIHDIVYRLTTSNLEVTYKIDDLRKLAGVKNYQEFGMMISKIGGYLPAISGFCGFPVRMRSNRGYSVSFRRGKNGN